MALEFYRQLAGWATGTVSIKDEQSQKRAVRLYGNSLDTAMLQIFTPVTRSDGRDSAKFISAHACLSRAQLIELRDAIDERIRALTPRGTTKNEPDT